MAYDEKLAGRIRALFAQSKGIVEKQMFGGLSFLLDGKMVCGVLKNDLIAKIGREKHEQISSRQHVRAFDFTGKPMMGMIYVAPGGLKTKKELSKWVQMATEHVKALPPKKGK